MTDDRCKADGIKAICEERFRHNGERFEQIDAKLDRIIESLDGNGKLGLKSRIGRIELAITIITGIAAAMGVWTIDWIVKVSSHMQGMVK